MKHFLRSETGYAFLLTLIFLPVFMGVSLLVIDVGRAHNAQQDLQAAADALALAGAAELDGQPDSRARAKTAMAKLSGAASNSVSFLGLPPNAGAVTLPYTVDSTAPFQVTFLKTIPFSDDDVIGGKYLTDNVAKSDSEARFVHVFARSNNLASFFFSPATRKRSELLIGATAVATQFRSTCDLTPMFMCSPFSGQKNPSAKDRLLTAFAAGDLHGQMFKLQTNPSGSLVSGNIGYLDTIGRSTDAVSRGLAGEPYPQCIELTDQVIPKTGAVASAWDGFNVRFDITSKGGPTSFAANTAFPAAKNVRKGWPVGQCELTGSFKGRQDFTQFPRFSDNRGPAIDAVRNSGTWNLTQAVTIPNSKKNAPSYIFPAYWPTLYPTTPLIEANVTSYAGKQPSRYNIYMYEQKMGLVSTASAGNETGLPSCITKKTDTSWEDRRTMLIAIVDCDGSTNGNAPLTVDAYAKVFLVNPVTGALDTGSDTLDIEIVDLSERSNGSIRNFIRDDIVLVR